MNFRIKIQAKLTIFSVIISLYTLANNPTFVTSMTKDNIIYPQYRKYSNNKSFFKILSPEKFEEIQVLRNKKMLNKFEAKILPDRNFISDLTFDYKKHWLVCDPSEFEDLKKLALIIQ